MRIGPTAWQAAAASLAAAVATASPLSAKIPTTLPRLEQAPCVVPLAGEQLRCGILVVPENRAKPRGREIRLPFTVLAARGPAARPDPIAYLPGGPGGSTHRSLAALAAMDDLRGEREIIVLEQRGAGYAQPGLHCPKAETPYVSFNLAALRRCRDGLARQGVDLSAYDSESAAADWDDLRRLLVGGPWNLYGSSYGSRLALTIMDRHAAGVRAVVLDSPYPPDVEPMSGNSASPLNALTRVFEACKYQPACNAAYPYLRARFLTTMDRLEKAPGTVNGRPFSARDFYETLLGGLDLADKAVVVPLAISAAYDGDYGRAASLMAGTWHKPPHGFDAGLAFSTGLSLSTECRERLPLAPREGAPLPTWESWPAPVEALARDYWDHQFRRACAIWTVTPRRAAELRPVASAIPLLQFVGEFDATSPPEWGERTIVRLSRGEVVWIPGAGHGQTDLPCPRSLMTAFFAAPARPLDRACLADMALRRFRLSEDAAVS